MAKKILVVDDDPDIVAMLETRLEADGYEVITAFDGAEALIRFREKTPDLVLLDIAMPGMDGVELAQILERSEKARKVPIIFITALWTKEEQERTGAWTSGHIIIAKPFDSKELLATIREAFSPPV